MDIKASVRDIRDIMKPKKDDELFKFAERGDLEGFLAAVPDAKIPKQSMGGPKDAKRFTILQKATDGIAGLLKKDFDVNAQNESGYTLLHVAALNGHTQFSEKLVTMGAETLAKDTAGNTPLHLATWGSHPQVVQVLLKHGSQFNDSNHEGNGPLHFAAQYGKDKQCAQILLENGANAMYRNRANETPLDLAARYGKTELVQLLASPEIIQQIYRKNERPKSSPLHLAARSGHREICGMLLEAGVKIDCLNSEGSTALHEATQFGKRDVVLFLLQSGANPSVTNDVSQTPLELFNTFNAKAQGNVIQQLLQAAQSGADKTKLAEIAASAVPLASEEKPKPKAKSKIKAKAVLAYAGSAYDPSVLSFEVGDIIFVDDQPASGWWKGTLEKNGLSGDFKANYVEIISDRSNEPDEPEIQPQPHSQPQPQYQPEPEKKSPGPIRVPAFGYGVSTEALQNRAKLTETHSEPMESFDIPPVTADTSVEQWLHSLKMERYLNNFLSNGFALLRDVRLMDAAQLDIIGIQLAGHRKKLLMAIEKIPDFPAQRKPSRPKSSTADLDLLIDDLEGENWTSPPPTRKSAASFNAALPPPILPPPLTSPPASATKSVALPPPILPPSLASAPASNPAPISLPSQPAAAPAATKPVAVAGPPKPAMETKPVIGTPPAAQKPEVIAKPIVPAATKPVVAPKAAAAAPAAAATKAPAPGELAEDVSFDDLMNDVEGMMADLEAELGNI